MPKIERWTRILDRSDVVRDHYRPDAKAIKSLCFAAKANSLKANIGIDSTCTNFGSYFVGFNDWLKSWNLAIQHVEFQIGTSCIIQIVGEKNQTSHWQMFIAPSLSTVTNYQVMCWKTWTTCPSSTMDHFGICFSCWFYLTSKTFCLI